jgi:hypothetical protein
MRALLSVLAGGFFVLVAPPQNALACMFDTDCQVGSKCVKAAGSIYGICAGGMYPGNQNDQQPVYAPLDLNQTYGDSCSFDTDCGPGSKCWKPQGNISGVCVKAN